MTPPSQRAGTALTANCSTTYNKSPGETATPDTGNQVGRHRRFGLAALPALSPPQVVAVGLPEGSYHLILLAGAEWSI